LRARAESLYAYRLWGDEHGHRAQQSHVFGKSLRSVIPNISYSGAGAERKYHGVALSKQGRAEFEALLGEKNRRA
jgi:hypothetical protein